MSPIVIDHVFKTVGENLVQKRQKNNGSESGWAIRRPAGHMWPAKALRKRSSNLKLPQT